MNYKIHFTKMCAVVFGIQDKLNFKIAIEKKYFFLSSGIGHVC